MRFNEDSTVLGSKAETLASFRLSLIYLGFQYYIFIGQIILRSLLWAGHSWNTAMSLSVRKLFVLLSMARWSIILHSPHLLHLYLVIGGNLTKSYTFRYFIFHHFLSTIISDVAQILLNSHHRILLPLLYILYCFLCQFFFRYNLLQFHSFIFCFPLDQWCPFFFFPQRMFFSQVFSPFPCFFFSS